MHGDFARDCWNEIPPMDHRFLSSRPKTLDPQMDPVACGPSPLVPPFARPVCLPVQEGPIHGMRSFSENTVIGLTGVSVQYRVPIEQMATLKEYVVRLLQGRRIEYRAFWALDGLDLSIRRGESLGIIGGAGPGKSTLLKVIARVLRPIRWDVAPLPSGRAQPMGGALAWSLG